MYVTLLDIPIYLRSYEGYYKEQNTYEGREIDKIAAYSGRTPKQERKRLEDNPQLYEILYSWPPWRFNDIVGWVSINYDGRFFAELWKLKKRKISRDPRHRRGNILFDGKIAEQVHGFIGEDLDRGLLQFLTEIRMILRKKKLYFPFEQWEILIHSLNCQSYIKALESKRQD